ncbi:MAG TPA: uroporphyrinogen-III synthase [Methylophilaceae bacterium]|nr:uroporphyrinogen-III synthase [Methylophilaceae bacterium]
MNDALRGRHIAITRPQDQAVKLSQLIEAAGGRVISFPLISIAPLEDQSAFQVQLEQLPACHWAIFISTNAVRYGVPALLKRFGKIPDRLRFAAIGPATAAELKKFGIDDTLTPNNGFDSESLLALPEMHNVASNNIMIFRGVGGREVLGETLWQRAAHVTFAECYRRTNPQKNLSLLDSYRGKNQLDAIVVTSSEAMRHLLQMGADRPWLSEVALCVNHERVAELPREKGMRVAAAGASGDKTMLDCLIRTLSDDRS